MTHKNSIHYEEWVIWVRGVQWHQGGGTVPIIFMRGISYESFREWTSWKEKVGIYLGQSQIYGIGLECGRNMFPNLHPQIYQPMDNDITSSHPFEQLQTLTYNTHLQHLLFESNFELG